MAKNRLITADELRQIVHYDPDTGIFTWIRPRPKIRVGQTAGYLHHIGYINIEINERIYMAHRLAWLHYYGEWPRHQIDHRDGDKTNNKIENLRDATDVENRLNRKVRADNISKRKGVTKTVRNGVTKYIVRVGLNGERRYLGFFTDLDEAHRAYCEAAKRLHGEFANFD